MKNFKYHNAEEAAMMFLVKAVGSRQVPITIEAGIPGYSYSAHSDVAITLKSSTNNHWTRIFMNTYQIIEHIKLHEGIDRSYVLWLENLLDTMDVEPWLVGHGDEYKECEEIVTCIISDMVCRGYLKKSKGIDTLTAIKVSDESTLLFMKETEHIPDDDPKDVLKL